MNYSKAYYEVIEKNNAVRVIIAGSRDFTDYKFLEQECDHLLQNIQENIVIVSGTANGADKLGEKYAQDKGYKLDKYPANWNLYGKSAGYKRNAQMADNADALIAFWDGKSKGTQHMINLATEKGLQVRVINF